MLRRMRRLVVAATLCSCRTSKRIFRGAIPIESGNYAIVCTAPCDTQLPAGLQWLGLSHPAID
jgi:hypothetical protein